MLNLLPMETLTSVPIWCSYYNHSTCRSHHLHSPPFQCINVKNCHHFPFVFFHCFSGMTSCGILYNPCKIQCWAVLTFLWEPTGSDFLMMLWEPDRFSNIYIYILGWWETVRLSNFYFFANSPGSQISQSLIYTTTTGSQISRFS
jgi:hypothetical protein